MIRIIDSGIVYAGRKGTGTQSCMTPGICVLPSGRWICGFRAAPTKIGTVGQHVRVSYSDDEGRSWSDAVSPFELQTVGGKPGLFRSAGLTSLGGDRIVAVLCWVDHSNPELPFFNEESEGLLPTKIFLSSSKDGGLTWSTPEQMGTSPFDIETPITGPILILKDGTWACQFELNKPYDDPEPWLHSSVLMYSSDEGKTWPSFSVLSNDPRIFYWDQRPSVLSDGTILNLFWTFDRQDAVYLNIHAKSSGDNGRTWSDMWDTGIPGQPAPPVTLPDGRIGMVYVDRTTSPVIKMRASDDGGRTWPAETEVVIHEATLDSQTWKKKSMQDAWAEMGAFSLGLPTTVSLADGNVLVAYYSGPDTDTTSIHWVRVTL